LAEVNRQPDARGLVIKRGTLVDATLITAQWGALTRAAASIRATPRLTRKRDKTYFGYKAHLAVDEGSGLMRQAEMTSANVHDSRFGEALIQGDEQAYFADRAYNSQALRETLERRGLVDGIAWKVKHSRYPLETCQTFHNACHLQLVAVAMNMKRALVIRRAAWPVRRRKASESAGKTKDRQPNGHKSPARPTKPVSPNLTPIVPATHSLM
jgi:hypothetical protein